MSQSPRFVRRVAGIHEPGGRTGTFLPMPVEVPVVVDVVTRILSFDEAAWDDRRYLSG